MIAYRNIQHGAANEANTTVIACVAETAPEKFAIATDWDPVPTRFIEGLTKLYRIAGVDYYGTL